MRVFIVWDSDDDDEWILGVYADASEAYKHAAYADADYRVTEEDVLTVFEAPPPPQPEPPKPCSSAIVVTDGRTGQVSTLMCQLSRGHEGSHQFPRYEFVEP